MHITVNRFPSENGATIGRLSIDGQPFCLTCEDVVREVPGEPVDKWKVPGQTAIPRGSYVVEVTWSPHFARELPLLQAVPGFSGVRIHPGNTAADTEGCLLVGYTRAAASVGRSRDAFNDLFPRIQAALQAGEIVSLSIA